MHWINIFYIPCISSTQQILKVLHMQIYASDLQTMIYISMDIHFNPISAGQGLIRPHNL